MSERLRMVDPCHTVAPLGGSAPKVVLKALTSSRSDSSYLFVFEQKAFWSFFSPLLSCLLIGRVKTTTFNYAEVLFFYKRHSTTSSVGTMASHVFSFDVFDWFTLMHWMASKENLASRVNPELGSIYQWAAGQYSTACPRRRKIPCSTTKARNVKSSGSHSLTHITWLPSYALHGQSRRWKRKDNDYLYPLYSTRSPILVGIVEFGSVGRLIKTQNSSLQLSYWCLLFAFTTYWKPPFMTSEGDEHR